MCANRGQGTVRSADRTVHYNWRHSAGFGLPSSSSPLPDLTYLDLTYLDLTYLDLTYLDLTYLDLTYLDLTYLDLTLKGIQSIVFLSVYRTVINLFAQLLINKPECGLCTSFTLLEDGYIRLIFYSPLS